ncbi:MAG: PEP-utilizing enzyme [Candidatus Diapherotrites archaeon]
MNIPCLIGTKTATKVFEDGEIVLVDAGKGTAEKVKK